MLTIRTHVVPGARGRDVLTLDQEWLGFDALGFFRMGRTSFLRSERNPSFLSVATPKGTLRAIRRLVVFFIGNIQHPV
jgi:hypothetical protein